MFPLEVFFDSSLYYAFIITYLLAFFWSSPFMSNILRNIFRRTINLLSCPFPPSNMRYFPNTYEIAKAKPADPTVTIAHIQEYVRGIISNVKPDAESVDGGLYVGSSGIAFMFYYLSKRLENNEYLTKAIEYIRPALMHPDEEKTAFLVGDAGTQALAAAIFHRLGDMKSAGRHVKNYQSLHHIYLDPDFLACGGDELFVGRAGYIAGALWLNRELGSQVLSDGALHQICDLIVESGRKYSKRNHLRTPLMYAYYRTEYLGAAHGLSFILQILITVPGYLASNLSAAGDIKQSIDYLLHHQSEDGNWACATDEIRKPEHKLVHWCHGAPGIVYLMARAYVVYGEEKYLNSCVKAAKCVWDKGLLRKGPGICHGVAGNGYVFLLLYRLTKDEKYLNCANCFAEFLQTPAFRHEARIPDRPFSLYEGTAGTVCFLTDLLHPHKAEFPFQDVFGVEQTS